jgi:hypothetical protein
LRVQLSTLLIYHSSVGVLNQENIVPYLLLLATAVVAAVGVARLRSAAPGGTPPLGALLVWALLFGFGVAVWIVSARLH